MTDTDDRAEFLAYRRSGIGGSDIPAILGLSKWAGPYSVWLDLMGMLPDDDSDDPMAERRLVGLDMEPALTRMFERHRPGLYIGRPQARVRHPRHEWARVTVDGFVYESPTAAADGETGCELGGYEAKTSDRAWTDGIPAEYQAQAQWGMLVTGLRKWWFGVMYGHFRFEVHELDYDPDDARLIVYAAARFWRRHVLTRQPPDPDEHDLDAIGRAYPGDKLLPAVAIEWEDVNDLTEARRQILYWTEVAEKATARMKARMGDAEIGEIAGRKVVAWMRTRQHVDSAKLAAEHPDVVAPYLRVDLKAFGSGKGSAERKRLADQYRTLPGTRPFRLLDPPKE